MARLLGNLDIVNLEPRIEAPLDARILCDNLDHLIDETWWNGAAMYNGLTVTVLDTDGNGTPGIYILSNKRDYTNLLAWIKVQGGGGSGDFEEIKDAVLHREANIASGYAKLDGDAKVLVDQLPSYIQQTITVDNYDNLPIEGEPNIVYVIKNGDTEHQARSTYRWTGVGYVQIPTSLIIGEILGTAYDGSRGYELENKVRNLEDIIGNTENLMDKTTDIVNKLNKMVTWYEVTN